MKKQTHLLQMLNRKNLTILSVCIVTFLSSCQKKESTNEAINANSAHLTASIINGTAVNPQNPNNPYDSYGQDLLSNLDAIRSTMPSSLTRAQRGAFVKTYLENKYSSSGLDIDNIVESALEDIGPFDQPHLFNFPETSTYFYYINQMDIICNNSIGVKYSVFKESFIELESQILNDNTIDDVQKMDLLSLSSQIRFDLFFDMGNASNDGDSIAMMTGCRTFKHLRCSSCSDTWGLARLAAAAAGKAINGK